MLLSRACLQKAQINGDMSWMAKNLKGDKNHGWLNETNEALEFKTKNYILKLLLSTVIKLF